MLLRTERQSKRAAFTLLEIIVVVAIILVLAGAAVVIVPKFLDDSRVSRAQIDVKTLEKAAVAFKVKHGQYPNNLAILADIQQDGSSAYISPESLKDPWGNDYHINPDELHPTTRMPAIYSNGDPTAPNSRPIRNWN